MLTRSNPNERAHDFHHLHCHKQPQPSRKSSNNKEYNDVASKSKFSQPKVDTNENLRSSDLTSDQPRRCRQPQRSKNKPCTFKQQDVSGCRDQPQQGHVVKTRGESRASNSKQLHHIHKEQQPARRSETQLETGFIIKHSESSMWQVVRELGSGGYGRVYLCMNCTNLSKTNGSAKLKPELCALKIERREQNRTSYLRHECHVYKQLRGSPYIPRLYMAGSCSQLHYMGLQILGKSIGEIRKRREHRMFDAPTTIYIARETLKCLQALHEHGIVHRDVKAANFATGYGNKWNRIYIFDFGLARVFRGNHNPTDAVEQPTHKVAFVGTTRYGSIEALLGREQSYRDDLKSWLYMVAELFKGRLPWYNFKDKMEVIDLKQRFSWEKLFESLPSAFVELAAHVNKLSFGKLADYSYMISLLDTVVSPHLRGCPTPQLNWQRRRFRRDGTSVVESIGDPLANCPGCKSTQLYLATNSNTVHQSIDNLSEHCKKSKSEVYGKGYSQLGSAAVDMKTDDHECMKNDLEMHIARQKRQSWSKVGISNKEKSGDSGEASQKYSQVGSDRLILRGNPTFLHDNNGKRFLMENHPSPRLKRDQNENTHTSCEEEVKQSLNQIQAPLNEHLDRNHVNKQLPLLSNQSCVDFNLKLKGTGVSIKERDANMSSLSYDQDPENKSLQQNQMAVCSAATTGLYGSPACDKRISCSHQIGSIQYFFCAMIRSITNNNLYYWSNFSPQTFFYVTV